MLGWLCFARRVLRRLALFRIIGRRVCRAYHLPEGLSWLCLAESVPFVVTHGAPPPSAVFPAEGGWATGYALAGTVQTAQVSHSSQVWLCFYRTPVLPARQSAIRASRLSLLLLQTSNIKLHTCLIGFVSQNRPGARRRRQTQDVASLQGAVTDPSGLTVQDPLFSCAGTVQVLHLHVK